MRIVFAFMVGFCFLLLGGTVPALAQTFRNATPAVIAQHTEKSVLRTDFMGLDFSTLKNTIGIDKIEDFYNIENDDDDNFAIGKYLPLAVAITCLLFSFHFLDVIKHRLPFCKHLSYAASSLYLRQRVLRI